MSSFLHVYRDLRNYGRRVAPRGQNILELEDYQFTMRPRERLTSFKARKLNLAYCIEEFLWYLRGERHDTSIEKHATMWAKIKDPADDGFNSNYGQYIFGEEQFSWVLAELARDPDSRRAVMVLLQRRHLRETNPDVVCTYGIGFRIREGLLKMSVSMRSNDAIFGLTNDVFCFSMLHEMVLTYLRRHYPDLKLGIYTHKVDSLHVYERHWGMLEQLVSDGLDGYERIDIPHAKDPVEYSLLRANDQQFDRSEYPFAAWMFDNRGEQ
jgi:thymidylate synthase